VHTSLARQIHTRANLLNGVASEPASVHQGLFADFQAISASVGEPFPGSWPRLDARASCSTTSRVRNDMTACTSAIVGPSG
jgi:hypothetical protein